MKKQYVIEPRHEDGSLNAKAIGTNPEIDRLSLGCTMEQMFDLFFRKNPEKTTSDTTELAEWFKSQGYYYRVKTW